MGINPIADPSFKNVGVQPDSAFRERFIQCVYEECQHKIECGVKYKKQIPIQSESRNLKTAHDHCYKTKKVQNIFGALVTTAMDPKAKIDDSIVCWLPKVQQ